MVEKICVYTCVMGDYESLNEWPKEVLCTAPHICFTDNPALTSDTWEIRHVTPIFPMDTVRSQRHIKILAHEYLPEFTASVYIDNTVRLRLSAENIVAQTLQDCNIAIFQHSYRDSVYDEFFAVAQDGLEDPARIFEQLNHYQLTHPEGLHEKPYWSGMLFRKHQDIGVRQVMTTWFNHVNRYARRDQLSLNAALSVHRHQAGLQLLRLALDNWQSLFHTWPILNNRRGEKRKNNWLMSGAPAQCELELLQQQVQQLSVALDTEKEKAQRLSEEKKIENYPWQVLSQEIQRRMLNKIRKGKV